MTELNKRQATASEEALWRIFTVPEAPDSTLSIIEQNISQNLAGFLRESIVAVEKPLWQIERDFQAHQIPFHHKKVYQHHQYYESKKHHSFGF